MGIPMNDALSAEKAKQARALYDVARGQIEMLRKHQEILRHMSARQELLKVIEDAIDDAKRRLAELQEDLDRYNAGAGR